MTTRRLTCGFVNGFDKLSTIRWRLRLRNTGGTPDDRRGRALFVSAFAITLSLLLPLKAEGSSWKHHEMNYKLHAHNILKDWNEFICLVELYEKESSWRPHARNGSHYGIPQGRSKWLATADGFAQVEWGIRYNLHRYGSQCKALRFFQKNNYH
jgi:hypothetical protein